MQDHLLDEKQVAERFGVSLAALRAWRWKKLGPRWIKIGKLCRYRPSDLESYLEAHERGEHAISGGPRP